MRAVLAVALIAAPAAAQSDEARFHLLQRETLRVASVFLRLTRAAAPDCTRRGPQLGLVLHQRAQYLPAVRAAAARVFGLGEQPAVLAVVPDSTAARAGLQTGDTVVAVDGRPLPTPAADASQGNAGRLAGAVLDRQAAAGPVALTVRRGDALLDLRLVAEQGCAGTMTLEPSQALTTQAGAGRIVITTALVEFVRSDDELAFLLGHELAHLAVGETRGRMAESAADLTGLRFAAFAGYDPCAAAAVLERLAAARHQGWRIDLDHPSSARRADALRGTAGGTCLANAG